jgi:hypothetical protein
MVRYGTWLLFAIGILKLISKSTYQSCYSTTQKSKHQSVFRIRIGSVFKWISGPESGLGIWIRIRIQAGKNEEISCALVKDRRLLLQLGSSSWRPKTKSRYIDGVPVLPQELCAANLHFIPENTTR